MTYDQWKAAQPQREEHPGFSYEPALDDDVCNNCGKPIHLDGPGCRYCDTKGQKNDNCN